MNYVGAVLLTTDNIQIHMSFVFKFRNGNTTVWNFVNIIVIGLTVLR